MDGSTDLRIGSSIVIGSLEFQRDDQRKEIYVNRLVTPGDPDGDGDHVATIEYVTINDWHAFVLAAVNGDVGPGSDTELRP